MAQPDWDNAPKDATHWNNQANLFYKFTLEEVLVYSPYLKAWAKSAFDTVDLRMSWFKARPRKSFLNGLLWWRR